MVQNDNSNVFPFVQVQMKVWEISPNLKDVPDEIKLTNDERIFFDHAMEQFKQAQLMVWQKMEREGQL
jgi:hypothetical protein